MNIWQLATKANEREFSGKAYNVVMAAIENALEEYADGTEAFEKAAMATLESNLSYPNECTSSDLDWFKANGVRW